MSFDEWLHAAGSEERARQIIEFLVDNQILRRDEEGTYRWYRAPSVGEEVISAIKISDLEEYYV